MKAISGLARPMSEALWWVMVQDTPYKYWSGDTPNSGCDMLQPDGFLVDPATGEILERTSMGQTE